jgi:hypothetical protein
VNCELKNEIQSLLSDLEKSRPDPESAEGVALEYLKCLLVEPGKGQMRVAFSDLKRFWLESVPWCSELSKSMEKLIMIYDEVMDRQKNETEGF